MIVQTPPLLHISPLILLTFDDFGGECFFARISAISGEFSQFPALSTPRYFILTHFGRPFLGGDLRWCGQLLGLNNLHPVGIEPGPVNEWWGALPLDQTDMGKVRNAPFAADFPRVSDFGRRFRERVILLHFPPGPESFFPNPVFYTPVDAFLTDSFL